MVGIHKACNYHVTGAHVFWIAIACASEPNLHLLFYTFNDSKNIPQTSFWIHTFQTLFLHHLPLISGATGHIQIVTWHLVLHLYVIISKAVLWIRVFLEAISSPVLLAITKLYTSVCKQYKNTQLNPEWIYHQLNRH